MNQAIIFVLALVILFGFFIFLSVSNGNKSFRKERLNDLKSKMFKIKNFHNDINQSEARDLIVQADSIFSKALSIKKYNTSTFSENIKDFKQKLGKELYNEIWQAHKKRNQVVHEQVNVDLSDLKRFLRAYYNGINKI